jgi:hypothetical protein
MIQLSSNIRRKILEDREALHYPHFLLADILNPK